jgi:hypothetical protein
MASPTFSNGFRRAADVLMEVSYHLVEPVVYTTITLPTIIAGQLQVTLPTLTGLYAGALVVLGWGSSTAEVLTVVSTSPSPANPGPGAALLSAPSFTHVTGETLLAPTFPTQQPTDPLFTQSEMLGYLARAQNNFLNKTPLVFALSQQALAYGQQYQATPPTAVEIERVASINGLTQTASLATVTRAAGVVTAILTAPAPSPAFTPGLAIQVQGVTDPTYNTATATVTILTTSADNLTLTWAQAGSDSTSTGGQCGPPYLTRMYETSQEQLTMRDPSWQANPSSLPPTSWYEDRTGVYQWGVAPVPRGNYFAEILTSQRDSETLALTDGFLLPDIFIPYVKYGVLAAAWSKDGEQRSPTLARFCQSRFDFGVMLAERFLRNVVTKTGQSVFETAVGGGGR